MLDRAALLARQEALENHSMAEGGKRFRAAMETAASKDRGADVGAGRKLLQMALDPLAQALAELVESSHSKRGRKHQVERFIHVLGPDTLAYLTIRRCVAACGRRGDNGLSTIATLAVALMDNVLDELRYRRLREEAQWLFDYRMEHFNTSSYTHKSRALNAALKHADVVVDDLELPHNQKLIIGVKLISLFVETTGMATVERQVKKQKSARSKPQTEVFLKPTEATLQWMTARNDALEFLRPVFMPMVVPPLPWTPGNLRSGGYRYALRCSASLVRGISKEHAETMKHTEMPAVYRALNAIQETPWRINRDVLAVVNAILDAGGGLGDIPLQSDEPVPAKPHDIATNPETRKVWRKAAGKIKERNYATKLARITFNQKYAVAKAMQDDDAIYFPCSVDFRGRVYPISRYITPQGDDLSKGLLTFAEAKPLGTDGAVWLALHGANVLDTTWDGVKLRKATLQERVDWIVSHTNDLERMATDPLGDRRWLDADKPWQFYAFCVEWANYAKADRAGVGHEYLCSLPCAMDGTCNGLQHFAAMFLDEVGGAAVNVVPQARPQDVYQCIADVVLTRLETDAVDNAFARRWLASGAVTRKLTKRPTMTFGYGSKKYGFQEQLVEYVKELGPDVRAHFMDGDKSVLGPSSSYMSGLIWDALTGIVVKASQGMTWMQDVARIVSRTGRCVEWRVPATGFAVRQEYVKREEHRVETILCGRVFRPTSQARTKTPDSYKQANAVAPNVVHSLDAAAMMLTVCACLDAGVRSFGMIHDSYATHAGDSGKLASRTRDAFARLYTERNVVEDLAVQFWNQAHATGKGIVWPLPPEPGKMVLDEVRASLYFFS